VARRPLRYTRSALLLMLAMSMGVFALAYGATWSSSQRDQAAYQAGADVRVRPGHGLGAMPGWALPAAVTGLDGVAKASPVERIEGRVSLAARASADLLTLDAATATDIVLMRADASVQPLGALLQALRDGRPAPALATLPPDTAYLRIVPRLEIGSITRTSGDPDVDVRTEQLDAATADVRLAAHAMLRDANGLVYRVESGLVAAAGSDAAPETELILPLLPIDQGRGRGVAYPGATLVGPIEVAALGVDVSLPETDVFTDGVVGIATVGAGPGSTGPWNDVPVTAGESWTAKLATGGQAPADIPPDQLRGTAIALTGSGLRGVIAGAGGRGPGGRIALLPSGVSSWADDVPVIANRAFLAASDAAAGDSVTGTIEGSTRRLVIAGVVETFPTTDADRPLLVLDGPTLGLLRLQGGGGARTPDEWWIAAEPGQAQTVAAALESGSFASQEVVTAAGRAQRLSTDPVALGIIGALTLGFVTTGVFAVVGLMVSGAVSARQRRTEFALLRALGLSGRQLAASLWLENGSIVLVSLLAGTSLGLVIGWAVLPFVSVTQQAAAPVPPVIVQFPWDRILVLEIVSAIALGVAVVVIGGVLRRLGVGSILRMGED
jgi:hypothetical protein